jgi:hypothetical protein
MFLNVRVLEFQRSVYYRVFRFKHVCVKGRTKDRADRCSLLTPETLVQFRLTSSDISIGRSRTGTQVFSEFFSSPPPVTIPQLLHTRVSPPHAACDSPDQVARCHTVCDPELRWSRSRQFLYISPTTYCQVKKTKAVPLRSIEAHLGDRRYSSYSFLTSALEGGEWSASRSGRALPPGKEPPVPIVQGPGWAPEPVWTQRLEEKSSACVGDRTPAVQSVDSHCTD